MKITTLTLAAVIMSAAPLLAKKTHSGRTNANTPEQELAGFIVPDGFVIELVASEKDGVVNPIDLTFDDAGRLWTQTARMYPLDPVKDIKWNQLLRLMDNPAEQDKNPEFKRIKDLYQGKTRGKDDILILSDFYSGKRPNVKKFATGLTIPQSILPYKKGAFVAQGSELFFLKDNNGDGKADQRIPVLTGFGFTDTHTMAHSLVRGPGGWVHFSQGALNKGAVKAVRSGNSARIDYSKIARFSLDGNQIELINAGLNNIWGFQLRSNGQWYLTEANDLGHSVNPAEPFTAFKGIGNEKLRRYQPFMPPLHKFRVGGTGISGLAFADDTSGSFPEQYRDVAFLANPITSTINCVKIIRNPDGTVTAKHLPDLLKSKDDWFRPVNIEFGPDGCLYIADWYNKIVSHNELPTTHPDRDKSHGRIWRIRHKSQKPRTIPNLYKVPNKDLIQHLQSPSLWEKRAAAYQIVDRQAQELVSDLLPLVSGKGNDKITRIHALWALEGLGAYHQKIIQNLIADKDGDIRREAIRSLATFKPTPDQVAGLLAPVIKDNNVMVRAQVIRTLENLGNATPKTIDIIVSYCRPSIEGNALGGSYERQFERYLARRALEKYPAELKAYITSSAATNQPATNLVWAMQALGKDAVPTFVKLWKEVKDRKLNLPMLVILSDMAKHPPVYNAVLPTFQDPNRAETLLKLASSKVEDTSSPALAKLLKTAADHLLISKDPAQQRLALLATQKLNIPADPNKIKPHLNSPELRLLALKALANNPKPHQALFLSLLGHEEMGIRLAALSAFGKANPSALGGKSATFLKANPSQKYALITTLGSTTHGAAALVQLLDHKLITPDDISYTIASRIHAVLPKNATANNVYQQASKARKADIAKAEKRKPSLIKLAEQKGGDASFGKALFQGMCLACHVVGEQGKGTAPALDGSGKRDPEALLTAILNPDAAVEGAYVLHRVITKDGDIIEGYRKRSDGRGVLIANMIEEVFIPKANITKSEFVGSQSFMPSGLITEMPDEAVKNLLAYIRSL